MSFKLTGIGVWRPLYVPIEEGNKNIPIVAPASLTFNRTSSARTPSSKEELVGE